MSDSRSPVRALAGVLRVEWDRALAAVLAVAAVVLAVGTYRAVARTPYVADQLSYLASGGVGALLCGAAAITLYVSAEHHDEWRQLDRIEALLRGTASAPPAATETTASALAAPAATNGERTLSPPARDLVAVASAVGVAVIVAIVGWRAAATTSDTGAAAAGFRTSLLAVLAVAGVCAAHAAIARQRLLARRAALLDGFLAPSRPTSTWRPVMPSVTGGEPIWSAPGLSRFHRKDCPALSGLAARSIPSGEAPAELRPCDLCIGAVS